MVWEETIGPGVQLKHLRDAKWLQLQLQAMNEMISASYNHPSVIFHAFFNEGPSESRDACPAYATAARAVRDRAPPSHRLVTWASSAKHKDRCLEFADAVAWNDYPGWYWWSAGLGADRAAAEWISHAAWARAKHPTKPFLVSESGAGAIFEWRDGSVVPRQLLGAGAGASKLQRVRKETKHADRSQILVLEDAPQDLWSQSYQAALLHDLVSVLLWSPEIAGFSIWQFADIKTDDWAADDCGPCEYTTDTQDAPLATPHNCAAYMPEACGFPITTSRPGGRNHKGLLDYWRRPKAAFDVVAQLLLHERVNGYTRGWWDVWRAPLWKLWRKRVVAALRHTLRKLRVQARMHGATGFGFGLTAGVAMVCITACLLVMLLWPWLVVQL